MFVNPSTRDGDLPPGIYERMPDGTLVMSKKVFTDDPPRPLHSDDRGQFTDVTRQDIDFLKELVLAHYELKEGHSLTTNKTRLTKFNDLVNRAAEETMGDR